MLYLGLVARVGVGVRVPDGALEEHGVLGYDGYGRAEVRQPDVTDVHLNMH